MDHKARKADQSKGAAEGSHAPSRTADPCVTPPAGWQEMRLPQPVPVKWRLGPPTAARVKGMFALARRLVAPLDAILVGGGVAAAARCQGIAPRDVLQQIRTATSYHHEREGMVSSRTHLKPGSLDKNTEAKLPLPTRGSPPGYFRLVASHGLSGVQTCPA